MKAMLVIQAKDGYAVAPYTGEIPAGFVLDMTVTTDLASYSYGDSVAKVLKAYFEPVIDRAPVASPEYGKLITAASGMEA